jgi:hypothetical protein
MTDLDFNYDYRFAKKYQEAANYLTKNLNFLFPDHFSEIMLKLCFS